ncbi:MAG: class I SAM-dependent methyltransferase [Spirochaetales bacterium]|jgi:ubiquinone/menaquinone biosynthesis C-methylase UbiE|nr:class I SAM-dependent methyltransferase [Spirochaetales bacterium]
MAWNTEKYNVTYGAKRTTLTTIWREVFGNDYPEEAEPTGFVTKTDLIRISELLSVGLGSTILDIGCGSGGPGLYVARELRSELVGVDLSAVAVENAKLRADDFDMSERARFICADVCSTGLSSDRFDGAMSVDVLHAVPDQYAVMLEVARVLRTNAQFVITTWESVDTGKDHYDSRLTATGFQVEEHYDKPDWEQRQRAVCDKIIAQKESIRAEMGKAAADPVIVEAEQTAGMLKMLRHVTISARKV